MNNNTSNNNEFALNFPGPASQYSKYIVGSAINADAIAEALAVDKYVILTDYRRVANILKKIGYKNDSLQIRLQKSVNASILERFFDSFFKTIGVAATRLSKGLYDGTKEKGTDFIVTLGDKRIKFETKIYKSVENMMLFAKNSKKAFHNADLVCCYILTDYQNHWHWLYKNNSGTYVKCNIPKFLAGSELPNLIFCYCTAGSMAEPWELQIY